MILQQLSIADFNVHFVFLNPIGDSALDFPVIRRAWITEISGGKLNEGPKFDLFKIVRAFQKPVILFGKSLEGFSPVVMDEVRLECCRIAVFNRMVDK